MAVLTDLPPDALLCLLDRIVATANTGHLLKLALVSTPTTPQMYCTVATRHLTKGITAAC
jgi:hypothetical protein